MLVGLTTHILLPIKVNEEAADTHLLEPPSSLGTSFTERETIIISNAPHQIGHFPSGS